MAIAKDLQLPLLLIVAALVVTFVSGWSLLGSIRRRQT